MGEKIKDIYAYCHGQREWQGISKLLVDLQDKLLNYYRTDRRRDYPDDYRERTNEVFSQFLQQLVYYITHNCSDTEERKEWSSGALESIINNSYFFYAFQGRVTIWVDPKEGSNALIAVCRTGYHARVAQLIAAAKETFGGANSDGFRDFLTHAEKDGFSALNTACKEGHGNVVSQLIAVAKEAFGRADTDGFRAFLTHANKDRFSPLNSVCRAGYADIVTQLIAAATEAFGGANTAGFRAFLTHEDNGGFSPFNSACRAGHLEIVKELIAIAKEAFGKDEKGFHAFLEQKNSDSSTPLNSACFPPKSKEIIALLIQHGANPDERNRKGFSARNNLAKRDRSLLYLLDKGRGTELFPPSGKRELSSPSRSSTSSAPASLFREGEGEREEEREMERERFPSSSLSSSSSWQPPSRYQRRSPRDTEEDYRVFGRSPVSTSSSSSSSQFFKKHEESSRRKRPRDEREEEQRHSGGDSYKKPYQKL